MNSSLLQISKFTLLLCLVVITNGLKAQNDLHINEVCPSNVTGLMNAYTGEYDDWIEIYNGGSSQVNLAGYGLSDIPGKPFVFTFPTGTTLNAGQRLVVFASDKDKTRNISSWYRVSGVNPTAGGWKYLRSGTSAPDTNWRNIGFNEVGWTSTSSSVENVSITNSAPTAVFMRKTFFLSNINEVNNILQGVLNVNYEDGYVVYINGKEIARSNLGTIGFRPLWNESARMSVDRITSDQQDSIPLDYDLLQSVLVTGQNVLALEVHKKLSSSSLYAAAYLSLGCQTAPQGSSGFSSIWTNSSSGFPSFPPRPTHDYYNANFKLSRSGETVCLTNNLGIVVDSFTYTSVESDNSVGICQDSSGIKTFFQSPTPNTANIRTCYQGYADIPLLDLSSGFYSGAQSCSLLPNAACASCVTRYTTNGDIPDTSDPVFTGSLPIDHTQTIRVRNFANGFMPSRVVTNLYVIDENIQLPVFSITTDSLNLWDYNTGIYVLGPPSNYTNVYPYKGANFWQDWKKPANVEFFDASKYKPFPSFDCDISIYGNYSRAKPQKSMELGLSDRFGTGSIRYNFITDKPWLDETDDIIIRNAGTDWNKVHFRDAFMERVLKPTHTGYIGAEPTAMYLNGEFWGVFTVHENHDEHWQKFNAGLDISELNYLKEDGSTITLKEGTDSLWWSIYNYATSTSPTDPSYYGFLNDRIDLENYADYFIAETYVNNGDWIGDWTNNIKMWSPRKPGGKLRYLVYDLDFGFGYGGASVSENRLHMAIDPSAFSHSSEIFDAITDNPTFRRYFINRYADLMNTIYLPLNLDRVRLSIQNVMAPDMPEHFNKWGGTMQDWTGTNIADMVDYYNRRLAVVRGQVNSEFALNGQVTWTLAVSPAGAGRIQISTIIPPSYPWSGVYFNGNPVTITAIPNPGYTFNHWNSNTLGNDYNQTVTTNYTSSQITTAFFSGSPRTPMVDISEINYNSSPTSDCGDWIELRNSDSAPIDLSDWKLRDELDYHIYTFPVGTVLQPGEYMVIAEDMLKFNEYYQNVGKVIGPMEFNFGNGGDQIRLLQESVYYQDIAPWPVEADGLGFTCERINFSLDPNDGTNWVAGCKGGSPCRAYTPTSFGIPLHVSGNLNICPGSGQSTQLSISIGAGFDYQWYRNNVILVGDTASVATVNQPGSYHVLVMNQGCSSRSDTAVVTVVSGNTPPVVDPVFICGSGTIQLTATAPDTVYWFSTISGGNPIAMGDTFQTPSLNSTVTYYAQTTLSCPSNRTIVSVPVIPITAIPAVRDTGLCGPGPITLHAMDTAQVRWYNAAVGGGLLNTGSSFYIPFLQSDTSFFVEAGTLCPSNRMVINVMMNETSVPTVSNYSRCGPGPAVITASCVDPVSWWSSLTGGQLLGNGALFTTPSLTQTDTFYVQSNGVCASSRVPAIVYVEPVPPLPTVRDTTVCGYGSVELFASALQQVSWYDAAANAPVQHLLQTGNPYTTPYFSSDTTVTYWVDNGYTCHSARVPIRLTIVSQRINPVIDTLADCSMPINLCVDPNAVFYQWSNGGSMACQFIQATDTYVCNSYYANSCVVIDSFHVDCFTGMMDPTSHIGLQSIYPNPADELTTLTLYSRESISAQVEIVDMLGRIVQHSTLRLQPGINQVEQDVHQISPGTYFVRVTHPDGVAFMEKIVVR